MPTKPQSAQSPAAPTGETRVWTGKTRGGVFGNWVFVTLIKYFGLLPAYALLLFVTAYFLFFAPTALRASHQYRARIGYGGGGYINRMWGAYKHFYALGITLIDRIAVLKGATSRFHFEFEGEDEIRSALAQGKGLVLTGAHCGNWELAAHLLAALDVPINILIFEGDRERVQGFFDKALKGRKFKLIGIDGSGDGGFEAIHVLSRGEVVAVLGDRVLDGDDKNVVSVPFLGTPARFPIGPHLLAAISGAGLIHAFAMRTRLYHYRFYVYPVQYLKLSSRARRQEELSEWVGLLVSRVENLLRLYPLQWNNFFDFWQDEAR